MELGNPFGDKSKEWKKRADKVEIWSYLRWKERLQELGVQTSPYRCKGITTTGLKIQCAKKVKLGEDFCFWHKYQRNQPRQCPWTDMDCPWEND